MCALEIAPAQGAERLILRAPAADDAERLCELANDLMVAANLSSLPHPYGPADAEAFLGASRDWRAAPVFAIEHRNLGFIGMVGFDEKHPGRTEVGYWLGRPFWGRGYATEAVKAALRFAAQGWGRKVVWAAHFTDNLASGQVLVKAGFLYTGEVTLRRSLARDELVASRWMVWLA